MTLEYCYCGKKAKWARYTQFGGTHYFCKKHAKLESDFREQDSSYFFWGKVQRKNEDAKKGKD